MNNGPIDSEASKAANEVVGPVNMEDKSAMRVVVEQDREIDDDGDMESTLFTINKKKSY